jgi:ribonucleoside-diphosphate reductase alpha chain
VQQDLLAPGGGGGGGGGGSHTRAVEVRQPKASQGGMQPLAARQDPGLVGACPDCGSQMEYAEGCVKCHVCGYSECG